MQRDSASHQGVPRLSTSARTKLLVSLGAAIVGGAAAAAVGAGRAAPLIGWDILAVVFCAWVWSTVWSFDAKSTSSHAQRGRADRSRPCEREPEVPPGRFRAGIGVRVLDPRPYRVHPQICTPVLLRQGRRDRLQRSRPPAVQRLAYLSFTVGMTFQVSDTNMEPKQIRRMALRHAWLSYPLGVVIIAASINLVAGLAK